MQTRTSPGNGNTKENSGRAKNMGLVIFRYTSYQSAGIRLRISHFHMPTNAHSKDGWGKWIGHPTKGKGEMGLIPKDHFLPLKKEIFGSKGPTHLNLNPAMGSACERQLPNLSCCGDFPFWNGWRWWEKGKVSPLLGKNNTSHHRRSAFEMPCFLPHGGGGKSTRKKQKGGGGGRHSWYMGIQQVLRSHNKMPTHHLKLITALLPIARDLTQKRRSKHTFICSWLKEHSWISLTWIFRPFSSHVRRVVFNRQVSSPLSFPVLLQFSQHFFSLLCAEACSFDSQAKQTQLGHFTRMNLRLKHILLPTQMIHFNPLHPFGKKVQFAVMSETAKHLHVSLQKTRQAYPYI